LYRNDTILPITDRPQNGSTTFNTLERHLTPHCD
jgi:hypothetical protein